ncbi:Arm DNA-binding domain-containing protein [Xanthobacter sp. DSM 14520]|uniref:Arm DNA-binding domain-containing protein n=1 Tax=Xanthobacter autotrophicus (strain ATCC BAA-1158 / Py2) TaxID=78245 RepID=UPI003727BE63
MEKITKRRLDALNPSKVGIQGSEQFLWDGELRGFGVRVSPAGLKSFIVQYRSPEGRHRRTVIGRYGLMTVEQAREERDRSAEVSARALIGPSKFSPPIRRSISRPRENRSSCVSEAMACPLQLMAKELAATKAASIKRR